jgi:transcriptional regulator with GAF, ATPase, and Fis domain
MQSGQQGLADLLACVATFAQSLGETFDPRHFLAQFSASAQRLIPHDRMLIAYMDDDARTCTVFAEHPGAGAPLHEGRYTTDFDPGGRYAAGEWDFDGVFRGAAMLVGDLESDARWADRPAARRRLLDAGVRSRAVVPLHAGGRIIGAFAVGSATPHRFTEQDLATCRQIAGVIGPFVDNVVHLHRERHRARRLRAVATLAPIIGSSLKVGDVVERLGEALHTIVDFDAMALRVVNPNGGRLELLGVLDTEEGPRYAAVAAPTEYSTSPRIAKGETVLVHDADVELDPTLPGDRRILARGRKSLLLVPLVFGHEVDGYVYFAKRRRHWYGEADVEIAQAVAAQIVIGVQHQRLAEKQEALAVIEAKAQALEARIESLRGALGDRYDFANVIGRAPAFVELLERAQRVAATEATVLLTGESGTGKEVVARAIHHASGRAAGAFVAVNCAALPETLIESELFGHERGAFTGADKLKRGRFELASGGTLFLDEIGDLMPGLQAKLLRVLQEREYERVGGTVTLTADVRLIAATNRQLERAVADGRFREDLYYRLAVFPLHLPALRDRGNDVVLLAEHFAAELGARLGRGDPGLSRDAREALLRHAWPGNIRELQNAIERALIVSDGGLITARQLGLLVPPDGAPAALAATDDSLADVERRTIQAALARAKGNKVRTAAALGISRMQLYTRLRRFGISS